MLLSQTHCQHLLLRGVLQLLRHAHRLEIALQCVHHCLVLCLGHGEPGLPCRLQVLQGLGVLCLLRFMLCMQGRELGLELQQLLWYSRVILVIRCIHTCSRVHTSKQRTRLAS